MPEDPIIVVTLRGGMIVNVDSSVEISGLRIVIVDYGDKSYMDEDFQCELYGDPCNIWEEDISMDEDFISEVMESI